MSRQLVARSSVLMFAAQFVARAAGLVVFACVARFLSVDEVGLFGYAMTMVGFLTIAVDFGFDLVVTREAARGSGSEGAGLALRLKTIHFLVAFPVLLVAAALHFKAIAQGRRSIYTCPIKALVNEKFMALCREFGPDNVIYHEGAKWEVASCGFR